MTPAAHLPYATPRVNHVLREMISTMELVVICPWCPDFTPGHPAHSGTTHRICPACLARLNAQIDQRGA